MEVLPRVADIMAEELGWSRKVKAVQIEAAKAYLENYGGRIPVEDDLHVRLPTLVSVCVLNNCEATTSFTEKMPQICVSLPSITTVTHLILYHIIYHEIGRGNGRIQRS